MFNMIFLNKDGTTEVSVTGYDKTKETEEFFIINLGSQIAKDKQIVVSMEFEGPIKGDGQGMYYSSYVDLNGDKQ